MTCADKKFYKLLKNNKQAIVNSVFKNVINIVCDGTFYSITTPSVVKAAYFLQIDSPLDFTKNFRTGEIISFSLEEMKGENVSFKFKDFSLFHHKRRSFNPCKEKVALYNELLKKETLESGPILFYKNNYLHEFTSFGAIDDYLCDKIYHLNELLEKQIPITNLKIVGVGLGSTPSGDDYLCGLYYGLSKLKMFPSYLTELKSYVSRFKSKTTDISKLMFQIYFENGDNELYSQFLSSLNKRSSLNAEDIYNKIKNIGHSSGIDFLIGMMNAVNLYIKRKEGKYV